MSDCPVVEFNISKFHFHIKLYVISILSQVAPIWGNLGQSQMLPLPSQQWVNYFFSFSDDCVSPSAILVEDFIRMFT